MASNVDPFIQSAALGLIVIVFARALVEKIADYSIYSATLRDYRLLPEFLAPAAAGALLAAEIFTLGLLLTPGMRGTARIKVGSRTVGQWLLRLLWQTFNFKM